MKLKDFLVKSIGQYSIEYIFGSLENNVENDISSLLTKRGPFNEILTSFLLPLYNDTIVLMNLVKGSKYYSLDEHKESVRY